jgi:arsenate reductase
MSTEALYPAIRQYLAQQEGKTPPANAVHHASLQKLATWLSQRKGKPAEIVVVCTGNSRRSILTSTLGNTLAAYRGWAGVKFHSAGTAPSAFNERTIKALQQIGVVITATGSQAKPGASGAMNPHYRVQWGEAVSSSAVEYSKVLGDISLPGKDFAAIMVCSEADGECPTVEGATLRMAMPFEDPKAFDGQPSEAAEYAKTRDLIAQTLLTLKV